MARRRTLLSGLASGLLGGSGCLRFQQQSTNEVDQPNNWLNRYQDLKEPQMVDEDLPNEVNWAFFPNSLIKYPAKNTNEDVYLASDQFFSINSNKGEINWAVDKETTIEPIVSNKHIITSGVGSTYSFNKSGDQIWSNSVSPQFQSLNYGDLIQTTTDSGESLINMVNPKTGGIAWTQKLPDAFGPTVLSLTITESLVCCLGPDYAVAHNKTEGDLRWIYNLNGQSPISVLSISGLFCVITRDGLIIIDAQSGRKKNFYSFSDSPQSLTITDQRGLILVFDSNIKMIDAKTSELVWSVEVSPNLSQPFFNLTRDSVYIASNSNYTIYEINTRDGELQRVASFQSVTPETDLQEAPLVVKDRVVLTTDFPGVFCLTID
jgi:hypothetical protein